MFKSKGTVYELMQRNTFSLLILVRILYLQYIIEKRRLFETAEERKAENKYFWII